MSTDWIAVNPPNVLTLGKYSHASVADGKRLIAVAGQVAVDEGGNVVGSEIETQADRALENLRRVLEAADASLEAVVSLRVYLTRREDATGFANVRSRYFSDPFPPSTMIVVNGLLLPDLIVEVEALAVV